MRDLMPFTVLGFLGLFLWNFALGQIYSEDNPDFDMDSASCGQMLSYVERNSQGGVVQTEPLPIFKVF